MALAEKGVAYTLQTCAPHTPEILALHPFGKIPALRDGEIEIWETAAILNYLDEGFDTGNSLRPTSIMERTRCVQWISAVNCYLYDTMITRYVLQIIFPKGEGGKPDRAVIDAALAEMPAQLAALDKAYGSGDYLAGCQPVRRRFVSGTDSGLRAVHARRRPLDGPLPQRVACAKPDPPARQLHQHQSPVASCSRPQGETAMSHLPGKFVWFEHVSNDVKGARDFYGALCGWTVQSEPMGEQSYDMIMKAAKPLAAFARPSSACPVTGFRICR